jgi:hypothetical protein
LILFLLMVASLGTRASAAVTTLQADADSFVLSTNLRANRGAATSLRVRNATKITYIRFQVPANGEQISTATLRVFATPARCTLGVEVLRAANDTWGETTINWGNQPGSSGPVIASQTWTTKGYRAFDVTAAVSAGGPVSFLLRHAEGCNASSDVSIPSREASTDRPQLVVETTSTPPDPACSDGADNDADGLIDHPADPGCVDAADTDETDPPPPSEEKVVVAAGDIACSPSVPYFSGSNPAKCQHRATADLLTGADAVLPLGDLQYPIGELDHFMAGYDPSWGVFASSTYPVAGNHEYDVPNAQGYFDYWASKGRPAGDIGAGYYVVNLGSWRLVALNSNCSPVPCKEGTTQNNFLESALAPPTPPCLLAYWHHPLFNSGQDHGAAMPSGARAFWDDLYAAGADLILNGHEHNYQRYAKQDPLGQPSENGIREFIVGTGGRGLYPLLDVKDANYETGNATDFGVLKLRLGESAYSWEFVGLNGTVLDAGGPVPCN